MDEYTNSSPLVSDQRHEILFLVPIVIVEPRPNLAGSMRSRIKLRCLAIVLHIVGYERPPTDVILQSLERGVKSWHHIGRIGKAVQLIERLDLSLLAVLTLCFLYVRFFKNIDWPPRVDNRIELGSGRGPAAGDELA